MTDLRQTILTLAARPEGLQTRDIQGHEPKDIHRRVHRLCESGHLYRAKVGHRSVWYFSTLQAAEQFEARHRPVHAPTVNIKTHAGWDRDAPMVITPATKYTVCPPTKAGGLRTSTYVEGWA